MNVDADSSVCTGGHRVSFWAERSTTLNSAFDSGVDLDHTSFYLCSGFAGSAPLGAPNVETVALPSGACTSGSGAVIRVWNDSDGDSIFDTTLVHEALSASEKYFCNTAFPKMRFRDLSAAALEENNRFVTLEYDANTAAISGFCTGGPGYNIRSFVDLNHNEMFDTGEPNATAVFCALRPTPTVTLKTNTETEKPRYKMLRFASSEAGATHYCASTASAVGGLYGPSHPNDGCWTPLTADNQIEASPTPSGQFGVWLKDSQNNVSSPYVTAYDTTHIGNSGIYARGQTQPPPGIGEISLNVQDSFGGTGSCLTASATAPDATSCSGASSLFDVTSFNITSEATLYLHVRNASNLFPFDPLPIRVHVSQIGRCPPFYIYVPGTPSFCVSSIEMRLAAGVTTNISTEWTTDPATVAYSNAVSNCSSIGTGYRLIKNSEWQTLARLIEAESSNWTLTSPTNIPHGNSRNGTLNTMTLSWPPSDSSGAVSRKFKVPNSSWYSEVWDLAGNLAEWVENDTGLASDIAFAAGATAEYYSGSSFPSGSATRLAFAPQNPGTAANAFNFGNLYSYTNSWGQIMRGGASNDAGGGLFAASVGWDGTQAAGYRCVYAP